MDRPGPLVSNRQMIPRRNRVFRTKYKASRIRILRVPSFHVSIEGITRLPCISAVAVHMDTSLSMLPSYPKDIDPEDTSFVSPYPRRFDVPRFRGLTGKYILSGPFYEPMVSRRTVLVKLCGYFSNFS